MGSIMCYVVATRSWPEIQSFFEDPWHPLQFCDQMGGIFAMGRRVTTQGAVHDIRQLQMMLRHLTSNLTFREAYDVTGRTLGITVCSPRKHEPPWCLNYLTSPHVDIWSAVTASRAFPGLFEAQELMAKDRNREVHGFGWKVGWVCRVEFGNGLPDMYVKCACREFAQKVLDEMPKRNADVVPNQYSVDMVFGWDLRSDGCWKHFVVERNLVGVVKEFAKGGVFANLFKLTKLTGKLCGLGKLVVARDVLHEVVKMGGRVEAASCNVLLAAMDRKGMLQGVNALICVRKDTGIPPSVMTYGIIVNHICKARRVDQVLEVLEKLKNSGAGREASVKPDVVIYNTRIDGFCKVDGMCRHERLGSAMESLKELQQSGVNASAVTYPTLITSIRNVNNMETARGLFGKIMSSGCHAFLSGLTLCGKMAKASAVASKIKDAGFSLDLKPDPGDGAAAGYKPKDFTKFWTKYPEFNLEVEVVSDGGRIDRGLRSRTSAEAEQAGNRTAKHAKPPAQPNTARQRIKYNLYAASSFTT